MNDEKHWTSLHALVRDRSRIQQISLDLLWLISSRRDVRAQGPAASNVYDLLVGVAFSLWRAVFLAENIDGWDGALANAEAFLEKLIRHNAITYMDDWNNRKWSFLYYLSNARYRLEELSETLPQFGAKIAEFRDLGAIHEPFAGSHPSHIFNALCNALDEAIYLLKQPDADAHDS